MKTCTGCKQDKPEEDFSWQRGKRRARCKRCALDAQNTRYRADPGKQLETVYRIRRRNREFVYQYYLTHPCADCGEARPECLEFHHHVGDDKVSDVGKLTHNTRSLDVIQAEIEKCMVLCANCHRVRTAAQQGWYAQGYVEKLGHWHGSFNPDVDAE